MSLEIIIENTPNPNAMKFIANQVVIAEGTASFTSKEEAQNNPLAQSILNAHEAVQEIYLCDNFVTVTQDGSADWEDLKPAVQNAMTESLSQENASFNPENQSLTEDEGGESVEEEAPAEETEKMLEQEETPTEEGEQDSQASDIDRIKEILDQTIRPALQRDGGDLSVLGYANNVLTIHYQGACGSCPHAAMGTLSVITRILKEQFHPDIKVQMG